MADSFIDPASQASLNQLLAALKAKNAELEGILTEARQSVTQFGTMSRETLAATQAEATKLSAARPAQTGTGTVKSTTSAVEKLAAAETRVNELLTQQIELRQTALKAAREQVAATEAQTAGATFLGKPGAPSIGLMAAAAGPQAGGAAQSAAARKAAQDARIFAEAQYGAANKTDVLVAAKQKDILATHQLDNELQRHGAMTSEFLGAMMRGEVTVREFGSQIATTIGKFGGWTLAAGAVYGVIGAVTELGRGAVDAQTAVGNLSRTIEGLNRTDAGESVIKVAHDTNVAMSEAGNAVFLFSRTFHDVTDASYVAGLALRAYKLDGVQVELQVRAMTALHQQFKVSAQGMGQVWGLLANGQRDYNARVNEMIPAIIGSATAVKNSGGDLTDYLKILQVALRTTQLTGAQLGTAFRRAPTFLNRPTSQQTLTALGFDPKQAINSFTDFFKEVMQRAPQMSGGNRRLLFQAVFGPQFGQRMAGLSTVDPKLYQQIMGQSVQSAGPLMVEFSKLLGTPTEQLKMILNNVQQIGAQLGRSGLLHPLGLVVELLNTGLHATEEMLKAFSSLPAPMREAAGYLAAFMTARGIAGKMNLPIPGIGPSAAQSSAKQIQVGMRAEQEYNMAALLSATRAGATTADVAARLEIERDSAVEANRVGQSAATEQRVIAAQVAFQDALAKSATAQATIAYYTDLEVKQKAQAVAYQAGINAGLSAEEAAIAAGFDYRLGTFTRGASVVGGVVPISAAAQQAEAEAAGQMSLFPAVAASSGAAAAASDTTTTAAEVAAARMAGTASRFGSLRSGMDTLGATVGKIALPLLGLGLVAGSVKSALDHADDAAKEATAALDKAPKSIDAINSQMGSLKDAADKSFKQMGVPAWLSGIPLIGGLGMGTAHLLTSAFGRNENNYSYGSQQERDYALYQRLWAPGGPFGAGTATADLGVSRQARPRGGVPWQGASSSPTVVGEGSFAAMLADAKRTAAEIPKTLQGQVEWGRYQQQVIARATALASQLKRSNTSPEDVRTITDALTGLKATVEAISQRYVPTLEQLMRAGNLAKWEHQDPAAIVNQMQGLADRAKLFGANNNDLATMAQAVAALADRFRNSNDPKQLENLIQAQSLFSTAATADVQDLIAKADQATTKGGKRADLRQAAALLRSREALLRKQAATIGAEIQIVGLTIAEAQAGIQAIAQAMEAAGGSPGSQIPGWTGSPAFAGGKTRGGPFTWAQAQQGYQGIVKRIQDRIATFGKVDKQTEDLWKQLETQIASGMRSATKPSSKTPASEDPYNLARLRSEIAQAQADGDPVKQAAIARQFAAVELAGARNENEKLQAQLDMVQADNQYWQAVEDRSQSVFDVLASKTTDPVKIARIQARQAQQLLSALGDRGLAGTQQWNEALAKRNQARQNLVDTTLTQSEDTIKFHLTMGDISVQTAINEYRALLSMHNITRAKRQEILQQIKQWQQQGQSDFSALDLGSIRLPTPYEIRRGLLGAQGGMTVRNSNTVHVNVTNPAAAGAVGVVLERYIGGIGKSMDRAAAR